MQLFKLSRKTNKQTIKNANESKAICVFIGNAVRTRHHVIFIGVRSNAYTFNRHRLIIIIILFPCGDRKPIPIEIATTAQKVNELQINARRFRIGIRICIFASISFGLGSSRIGFIFYKLHPSGIQNQ